MCIVTIITVVNIGISLNGVIIIILMLREDDPPLRVPGQTMELSHTQFANFSLLLDYLIFCLILCDFSLSTFSTSLGFPSPPSIFRRQTHCFVTQSSPQSPRFHFSLLSTFFTASSWWNLNHFFRHSTQKFSKHKTSMAVI